MTTIGAAYLRCSDPRQDKSVQQQKEEIERRAAADGVVIPASNWFVLCGAPHKTKYAELGIMRRTSAISGSEASQWSRHPA